MNVVLDKDHKRDLNNVLKVIMEENLSKAAIRTEISDLIQIEDFAKKFGSEQQRPHSAYQGDTGRLGMRKSKDSSALPGIIINKWSCDSCRKKISQISVSKYQQIPD